MISKMKNISIKSIALVCGISMFVSCNNDDSYTMDDEGGLTIRSISRVLDGTLTPFDEDDIISLHEFNQGIDSEYKFDGNNWMRISSDIIYFSASKTLNLCAYNKIEGAKFNEYQMTFQNYVVDQSSEEKLASCDFIFQHQESVSSKLVQFELEHQLSKVKFIINTEDKINSALVKNVLSKMVYDIDIKQWSADLNSNRVNIQSYIDNTGNSSVVTAYILPGEWNAEIQLTDGSGNTKTAIGDRINLQSGKVYTLNVINDNYGQLRISGSISVQDWNSEENIASGTITSTKVWDGISKEKFNGEGTLVSPYQIENGAQLAYLSEQVSAGNNYATKYFKLTKDIDLGGHEWIPIGTNNNNQPKPFSANFDGNNFTIKNVKINNDGNKMVGIFGFVKGKDINNRVILKNLTISSCDFSKSNPSASNHFQCGVFIGNMHSNVTIENCIAINSKISAQGNSGGLVGIVQDRYNVIVNSHVIDVELLSNTNAGGVVGTLNNGVLIGCSATGSIKSNVSGGIVAILGDTKIVEKTIICGCSSNLKIESKGVNVGGLVGQSKCGIIGCYSLSSFTIETNGGGLVGTYYNKEDNLFIDYLDIKSCYTDFAGNAIKAFSTTPTPPLTNNNDTKGTTMKFDGDKSDEIAAMNTAIAEALQDEDYNCKYVLSESENPFPYVVEVTPKQ